MKEDEDMTTSTGADEDALLGMATALSIDQRNPSKESKCEYEKDPRLSVNFLCMQPNKSSKSSDNKVDDEVMALLDKAVTARFQEIFIDLVAMRCASLEAASPRHILDDRFDSYLGEGDRDFKDSLMEFLAKQTDQAKQTHAYQYLENILRSEMGYRTTYFWACRKNYGRPDHGVNKLRQVFSYLTTGGERGQDPEKAPSSELSNQSKKRINDDPGHVFVCNASVCDIQCDAFLCPASISKVKGRLTGTIRTQWIRNTLQTNPILSHNVHSEPFDFAVYPQQDRVVTLSDWPWKELASATQTDSASPVPFVVFGEVSLEKSQEFAATPESTKRGLLPPQDQHIMALMETVRQFLDVALLELKENQPNPHCNRQRYLLALPVLGTGGGFAGDLMGVVVENLLSLLSNYVNQNREVDVVMVCADEAAYTHAQMIRQRCFERVATGVTNNNEDATTEGGSIPFPCFAKLDSEQHKNALRLAKLASTRHLSLFLGAGVSIGSGLPSWFGLLHWIEDQFTPTGAPTERSLGDTTKWDPLAMADQLQDWCDSGTDRNGQHLSMKQRVCNHLQENGRRPGLLLSLLVSLPCHSMVTQNYDNLIETACSNWSIAQNNSAGNTEDNSKRRLSVIPYKPVRNSHYWLLKMHGCVAAPKEIILTSNDYAAYDSSRSKALAGLVQASLMTKHLLFVGFSLSDPNYLKIVDQVRHALRPYSEH